ncbi:MAG: hypothetical protein JWP15_2061, partial [Alphaproteobacteria bacterium]|nr:hypothetical protein [Alphaproteobacteria bacterium]
AETSLAAESAVRPADPSEETSRHMPDVETPESPEATPAQENEEEDFPYRHSRESGNPDP